MKDLQQKKAYDWEDSFTLWAGAHMSQSAARQLIRRAAIKYRIEIPKVHFYRSNNRNGKERPSHYDPSAHIVRLRPRHLNAAIVLHESAHAIHCKLLGFDIEDHGPEWVGIYMVLLEDFKIMPRVALYATADAVKLRYRKRGFMEPKKIRKRYKKKRREARAQWRWLQ